MLVLVFTGAPAPSPPARPPARPPWLRAAAAPGARASTPRTVAMLLRTAVRIGVRLRARPDAGV